MKKTLMLVLLLFSASSFASEWVMLTYNDTSKFYVDSQSVIYSPKYSKAWFKTESYEPQPYGIKQIDSVKALWYFNCNNRTVTVIQNIGYSGQDVAVSYKTKLSNATFSEIVPDSFGERAFNYICLGK